ncbi:MAG: hypothetical protein GX073_00770 [Firmicutes bacterium]|nr:hypothetical protein [Bacillota bacterium]
MQIGGKTVTVKKTLVFLAGMSCVAMGMTLYVHAGSGAEPWSLFYAGVSMASGLPLGTVVQLTGVVMVATVCLAERVLPGPGTVGSFVVIGFFSNLFAKLDFSWLGTGLWWEVLAWAAATLLLSLGLGVYVTADLGEGSIELVQFFLVRKLKRNPVTVRIIMDGTASLVGFFLGGPLGVGTVCSALCIGPLLDFFSRLSRRYIFNER